MPKINIDINDLKNLLKMEIKENELFEILSLLKCEVETIINNKITIEVTSDRPDLFSCEGIARAIKIYLKGYEWEPKILNSESIKLFVDKSVENIRPYIVAVAIKGVELNEEAIIQIMQLQEKLHSTYCSNRKKGSIGIYDLDKVSPPLYYKALNPKEINFIPLGYSKVMNGFDILKYTSKGMEYSWILEGKDKFPLLYDSKGIVLSMPPIINSEDTKVTENTKNIIIDVTGIDENIINSCLNIMSTSILERGGSIQFFEIVYENRKIKTPNLNSIKTKLNINTVNKVLGLNLNSEEIIKLLSKMGHKVSNNFEIISPPYRIDILHEIDLIEDIAIALGLNNIPPEIPKIATIGKPLKNSRIRARIRDLMIGMGFQEVITYILSSRNILEEKSLMKKREFVEIINPISSEYAVLRDCLIPKLLYFLSRNLHQPYPQRIFEYGDVVYIEEGKAKISTHLAAVIADYKVSYEDIQAIVVSLFKNLSKNISFKPYNDMPFIEGRAAKIILEGMEIGVVGEISPKVIINFGLETPVGAFECEI
ncbi:MAG: phenylalanine--tRNA ligase subunit beta [Candidatus Methanomethylicaceae archaeon]